MAKADNDSASKPKHKRNRSPRENTNDRNRRRKKERDTRASKTKPNQGGRPPTLKNTKSILGKVYYLIREVSPSDYAKQSSQKKYKYKFTKKKWSAPLFIKVLLTEGFIEEEVNPRYLNSWLKTHKATKGEGPHW